MMMPSRLPLMQGTLDLLVLHAIGSGPMHGYAIAARIGQRTAGVLIIEDAALYQALHRLERQELVEAEWRPSENNRRARYYRLTSAGRKRLRQETANWRQYTQAVDAVLQT